MNDEELYKKYLKFITLREGKVNTVYADKDRQGNIKGYSVGVGHLVKPEDNLKFGDRISDERVQKFLEMDGRKSFNAGKAQAAELGITDPDFIIVLGSVNFQLGTGWNKEFDTTWKLIKAGKFEQAAKRLETLDWSKQTPVRVKDFQKVLREQGGKKKPTQQATATSSVENNRHLRAEFERVHEGTPLRLVVHAPRSVDVGQTPTNGASVLRLTAA